MAGFEFIVRPAILPSIRPPAAPRLAPDDDPAQGIATLTGTGGKMIDLTFQYQSSTSRQGTHKEQQREYDVDRVYQKQDDGTVNKDNYVDVERISEIHAVDQYGNYLRLRLVDPPEQDNVTTLVRRQVRKA